MPESEVVRACLYYLRLRGILAWRNNAGVIPLAGGGFRRFSGMKGASDIFGIVPQEVRDGKGTTLCGVFLAVECKAPKGRLRPEQDTFLKEIDRRGGIAMVVRSVDDLAEGLTRFPFKVL